MSIVHNIIISYQHSYHIQDIISLKHSRWLSPTYGTPGIQPAAFQCSDDAFDIKIRGETIICGLRNGTVELYNIHNFQKELTLDDQNGSVQVSFSSLDLFAKIYTVYNMYM